RAVLELASVPTRRSSDLEGRRIFAELTVEENLRLGLAGRRNLDSVAEDMRQVYDLFPVVEEARRRKAGTLSGGEQVVDLSHVLRSEEHTSELQSRGHLVC